MAKVVGPQISKELFQRELSRQNWQLGLLNVIAEICERISNRSFTPYLVGGAIRDIVLLKTKRFRDIDVIVEKAKKQDLEELFSVYEVDRNSFGGMRLYRTAPSKERIAIDIWALEDTWALRHTSQVPTIQRFLKTPFLNIDAVAAKPNRSNKWQIYDRGFTEAVRTKTIGINYEPNPDPLLCAFRAILAAQKFRYQLSLDAAKYVLTQLEAAPSSEWRDAQIRHYGKECLQKATVTELVGSIARQIRDETRSDVGVN